MEPATDAFDPHVEFWDELIDDGDPYLQEPLRSCERDTRDRVVAGEVFCPKCPSRVVQVFLCPERHPIVQAHRVIVSVAASRDTRREFTMVGRREICPGDQDSVDVGVLCQRGHVSVFRPHELLRLVRTFLQPGRTMPARMRARAHRSS